MYVYVCAISCPFLYGKWHRFLRFLLFLNEQVERHGKMTSMIKIDLEPQSSAQMEPIHSVRAGIFSAGCVTPTICASFQILDDWDAQSAKIGWFDELWWIVMNCDELWWIMMNYDELWWIMMNYDELWWIMMNYDELWWIMMNYMAGIRPKASSDGNSPALIPAAPLTLTHLFQPQRELSIFLKQKVIWLKQS